MTLALTCTLCLASAPQLAAATPADGAATTLTLASAPVQPDLRLADAGAPLKLAPDDQEAPVGSGGDEPGDHGAWMGTTMIVVMVVMMVGVGAVMMAHATYHSAPTSSAAAAALPVLPARGFAVPGG